MYNTTLQLHRLSYSRLRAQLSPKGEPGTSPASEGGCKSTIIAITLRAVVVFTPVDSFIPDLSSSATLFVLGQTMSQPSQTPVESTRAESSAYGGDGAAEALPVASTIYRTALIKYQASNGPGIAEALGVVESLVNVRIPADILQPFISRFPPLPLPPPYCKTFA